MIIQISDEEYKEEYVQPQIKNYAKQNGRGGLVICKHPQPGFKEWHDYKPTYDENTQYIKYIGYGECSKYILSVFKVFDYYNSPEETNTENTESATEV